MAEEKKEEVAKEETEQKKEEKTEEKPAEKSAEKMAQPESVQKKKEVPARVKASNCTKCNKVLKRGKWYYKNGKYYCNKRCWKKSTEKVA